MERNYRRIGDRSKAIKYSLHQSVSLSHRFSLAARLLKTLSSKAEPTNAPEAYPLGYVEDAFKVRTPLDGVFSSLSKQEVALRHREYRHRITCQNLPVGFHHIGFRIYFNVRQRIVQLHIALADAAAFLHRRHAFLQAE